MKPLIAFIVAASLALTIGTPSAQARSGATVIKGFECVIVPADSGIPILLFSQDVTREVDTPSGNSILQCHFEIPKRYVPSQTMHHAGFLCGTLFGLTTNSKSVTTKSGKVLLTCIVKHR
ncbi:MAG TPA: hypothetical protein VK909_14810 [Anaerolineales bacterium]|jgi:hypothetical protein|nr:hypothetical protein [Anaerolineales bacterium]